MTRANRKVWAMSLILWIAAAAVATFNTAAALLRSEALTYAALTVTGLLALAGIGFGLWAGWTLASARSDAG